MSTILLVGEDAALLEGLTQSFVAAGHTPRLAHSLREATEIASFEAPLVSIIDRALLAAQPAAALAMPRVAGGALVLYRTIGSMAVTLPPAVQRSVLADLTLPLERHRLLALVQSVAERAQATGRASKRTAPERPTP